MDLSREAPNPKSPEFKAPGLLVTSWQSFSRISEIFEHDENGKLVFSHTGFTILDPCDGTIYYGHLPIPKKNLSLEQARCSLKNVPPVEIYPPFSPDLSVSSSTDVDLDVTVHIKRPKLILYDKLAGTTVIADRFLDEARVLEIIRQNPHPNLVEPRGCLVRENRIVGLTMKRYPYMLRDRVRDADRTPPLDKDACLRGIVAGVGHLQMLGMAHNDLNPSNIMVDDDGNPVIIDIGSCKPIGQALTELGTPGWNDGFEDNSSHRNDEIGLEKIREWLY